MRPQYSKINRAVLWIFAAIILAVVGFSITANRLEEQKRQRELINCESASVEAIKKPVEVNKPAEQPKQEATKPVDDQTQKK